ncbi:MAG: UDP-N-acetylmuramoyl-L-alanine--D-glutamate ligase [Deltaproteobacteria bacterium]|nr:UDP-N-acetylmuramoyl-L-alanine--D-glutamate ligase [Deltaproteobacteria bacterium]
MQSPQRDLAGKRVLVVGLGRSGLAAARLCAGKGALVTVNDAKPASKLEAELASLPASIGRELGGHPDAVFEGQDLIVLSPGVPPLPSIAAARARGALVTGEIELASWFIESTMVAITGTNGKSTTTSLCGSILAANGQPTFVGGNLGTPLCEAVGTPAGRQGGTCVVEVSSFQLETARTLRPQVAVLLNISPDHLDRYPDIESYIAAKQRVFAAQTASDFAVINIDDPNVEAAARKIHSRCILISTHQALAVGGWVDGDSLCVRLPGGPVEYYPAQLPGLVGRHNQENALAALVAARLLGALPAEARYALVSFRSLPHRMELVGDFGDIEFYDDSKGTNVGAVVAALDGFPRKVVLIAGGRDKGGSYAPLAEAMRKQGRAAVLIGEAAPKIRAALTGVVPVEMANDMDEAVQLAAGMAERGDAVVLSPACSSFDMYRDYAHRAEAYRIAVQTLITSTSDKIPIDPEVD